MGELTIADLMTSAPAAVRPTASLAEATACMVDQRVSGVPVIDADRHVVGILTEGDLLRRAELATQPAASWLRDHFLTRDAAGIYVRGHSRQVAEIMTSPVHCVALAAPLLQAIEIMTEKNVRRLPVTEDGVLVGIISRWDFVRRLNELLQNSALPVSDAVIGARIDAALAAEKWAPWGITATVENGEVALAGCARTEADLQALRVMAENVPGVKRVRDELFLLSPGTGWSRPGDL